MIVRKLKEIYDGWNNYIFPTPEIEALAKYRAIICSSCDFMVSGICTKCGCPGLAKHRSPTSACPINKWGPMVIETTDMPDVPMNMFNTSDDYLKHLSNGKNNTKVIPTFEELVRINIGKLKSAIGSDSFTLEELQTETKSGLIQAINETKSSVTPQEIFTRSYGVSPNRVTIKYTKDEFGNETILHSLIT